MSLMGKPLLVVLALCTVAFPLLVFFCWSRLRHPVLGRLGRLALVVASQVSAVLLVAALLNDYGYFYSSWGELFASAAPAAPISSPAGGAHGVVWAPGRTPVTGVEQVRHLDSFSTPGQYRKRGTLERIRIHGANTGLSTRGYIYVPPQYYAPRNRHRRFPAVEVLTGYPGVAKQEVLRMRYPDIMLHDLRVHSAKPMILVMLRSSVAYPRDAECTDVPGGPQALSFFTQDVPAAIEQHYRVVPNRWGAMGDSTGGYCAAKIAMTDPSIFRAAVSISGYFTALKDWTTGDLWGGSTELRNLNNLDWRLQHLPAPDVSLLVSTSRDENGPLGHDNTYRFLRLVKPPMTVQSIIEPHGGHVFTTWLPQMPETLAWLSHHLYPSGAPSL